VVGADSTAAVAGRSERLAATEQQPIRLIVAALRVHSRLEAVVWAQRLGLVQPRRPD